MKKNFYLTKTWRQLRERVLNLYGTACMNCGKTPQETHKAPQVDHIFPRSKFPSMELQLNNLQVLCEDCNCGLKGTSIVDYRRTEHINMIESIESGKHLLSLQQRVYLQERPMNTKSDSGKEYDCRREVEAVSRLQSKRKQSKRLKHLIHQYGEILVRKQLERL